MKIAVVGAGISGLGAALALSETHEVQVFEREGRIGGHANTAEVAFEDGVQPVDTGFIVYNQRNYPNLCALFEHLDVPTRWSDMSFGFSLGGGACEYACDSLDKLFAQRWRALDPRFVGMAREILRFTKIAPADMEAGRLAGLSLGEWLAERGFGRWFRERFLLPMGGAIWSTSAQEILDFPAVNFVAFFCNHDLMTGLDPAQRWRTVDGGSREYVRRVHAQLGPRVLPGREAVAVETAGARPVVRFADGGEESFDQVILAVHGPQALGLLRGADDQQRQLLGAFRTSENRAVLHSDTRLMPRRKRVWSSWNFLADAEEYADGRPAQVTYWMNRLQGIPETRPLFVSLNARAEIDPTLVHGTYDYAHPFFDQAAFNAQGQMDAIQGRGGVWYAGAWLGYGFHEDGLRAGLRVAAALGARPAWAMDIGRPMAQADAA
ncbi:MAG: FAD-dependent oxidoreductase [Pseudomonadota bacterium]